MAKTGREFSLEFKREAVAPPESGGRPLMRVATEAGLSPSMLRNWRAAVRAGTVRSRAVTPMPSPADQASEIRRLKRAPDRMRVERDVPKKSDRHLRGGAGMSFAFIRDHADRWPVRLMCRILDVSTGGCHAWRGRPDSARACRPCTRRRRASSPCRASWPLRQSGDACRAPRGGRDGKSWPRRASDAASRYPCARRVPVLAVRHRQPPVSAGRAEPAEPGVRRRGAEPRLAFRRMRALAFRPAAADITRIATRRPAGHREAMSREGAKDRRISPPRSTWRPKDRRTGDARPSADRASARRADDGLAAAQTGARPHPPFRSRRPIRIRGIRKADHRDESETINEPDRLPPRQRAHGELLPYAQGRTHPPARTGDA